MLSAGKTAKVKTPTPAERAKKAELEGLDHEYRDLELVQQKAQDHAGSLRGVAEDAASASSIADQEEVGRKNKYEGDVSAEKEFRNSIKGIGDNLDVAMKKHASASDHAKWLREHYQKTFIQRLEREQLAAIEQNKVNRLAAIVCVSGEISRLRAKIAGVTPGVTAEQNELQHVSLIDSVTPPPKPDDHLQAEAAAKQLGDDVNTTKELIKRKEEDPFYKDRVAKSHEEYLAAQNDKKARGKTKRVARNNFEAVQTENYERQKRMANLVKRMKAIQKG